MFIRRRHLRQSQLINYIINKKQFASSNVDKKYPKYVVKLLMLIYFISVKNCKYISVFEVLLMKIQIGTN